MVLIGLDSTSDDLCVRDGFLGIGSNTKAPRQITTGRRGQKGGPRNFGSNFGFPVGFQEQNACPKQHEKEFGWESSTRYFSPPFPIAEATDNSFSRSELLVFSRDLI